jgi:hypothetical protein
VIKPALILIEGPDKVARRGSKWELIKILYENLAYNLNWTQRTFFQLGLAIEELMILRTGLGTKNQSGSIEWLKQIHDP